MSDWTGREDPPALTLTLWPHRSLPRGHTGGLILMISAMALIPIGPLIWLGFGPVFLPYSALAIFGLWVAIRSSHRTGRLTEELRLWPDLIAVERREVSGRVRRWTANPYWVQVRLHPDAAIEDYLTLKGDGREIELGAFLSPEERRSLKTDLEDALQRMRAAR